MTRDLRVLILNCEFPPLGGGAATATRHLLDELEDFPVEVTLVTASVGASASATRFNSRSEIHYLPVGKADLHYWSSRELLSYAWAARRHVGRLLAEGREFDVCHAFFTVPTGAAALAHSSRMPYAVSLRGSDVPGFSGRFSLLYKALGPLFRLVWRRAEAVVANSEELADLARASACGTEIGVIPNGVDTETFFPGPERVGGHTLLSVARLIPRKDLATAVRAAALLAREFADLKLVVAGDGPDLAELSALASALGAAGNVQFRRSVPREEMAQVYRSADVFVMTSAREGMSNTVLEALASGLPLVVSRDALSGIDAPGASVVETGDAEGVARAAGALLRDARLRREAAEASRAAAMRYTWRVMAERYFDLYRRIAGARLPDCGTVPAAQAADRRDSEAR